MIWKNFVALFFLCLLSTYFPLFGQQITGEVSPHESAIALYRDSVENNSSLYKGEIYAGVNQIIKGHPFLLSEKWIIGTIQYRGNIYREVPMLYDIYKDELIVLHTNGFLKVQLLKRELSYFSIYNRSFYHLKKNIYPDVSFQPGIYERIYEGEHTIFVKRRKNVTEVIQEMVVEREFESVDDFFIEKDNILYAVKGKGSVLNILKDRKKIVKKGLRENNIKYRKNPELAIVKMVEFYEMASE